MCSDQLIIFAMAWTHYAAETIERVEEILPVVAAAPAPQAGKSLMVSHAIQPFASAAAAAWDPMDSV